MKFAAIRNMDVLETGATGNMVVVENNEAMLVSSQHNSTLI